jgi:hypothetical protein
MNGLKVFFRLIGTFFGMCLGLFAWLAPHLDFSRVKDESLLSTRGCLVLGMMIWVCLTLVTSALDVLCVKCANMRLALVDLMNFKKRSVLTSRQPVQDAFNKVQKVLDE